MSAALRARLEAAQGRRARALARLQHGEAPDEVQELTEALRLLELEVEALQAARLGCVVEEQERRAELRQVKLAQLGLRLDWRVAGSLPLICLAWGALDELTSGVRLSALASWLLLGLCSVEGCCWAWRVSRRRRYRAGGLHRVAAGAGEDLAGSARSGGDLPAPQAASVLARASRLANLLSL